MRIGTTPTHIFAIPISVDIVQDVEITYCQNGRIILQKRKDNCTLDGNTITTKLTQDETFKFNEKVGVEIQLRVLDLTGAAFASDIIRVSAEKCLSKDVLA